MPSITTKRRSTPTRKTRGRSKQRRARGSQLSVRTRKQIDSLPQHAQHIYKKVHSNAVKQYKNPEKRRGGKRQSAEQVAHKAAWAAVKRDYTKKGDKWMRKAA
jgi:cation transport regulator